VRGTNLTEHMSGDNTKKRKVEKSAEEGVKRMAEMKDAEPPSSFWLFVNPLEIGPNGGGTMRENVYVKDDENLSHAPVVEPEKVPSLVKAGDIVTVTFHGRNKHSWEFSTGDRYEGTDNHFKCEVQRTSFLGSAGSKVITLSVHLQEPGMMLDIIVKYGERAAVVEVPRTQEYFKLLPTKDDGHLQDYDDFVALWHRFLFAPFEVSALAITVHRNRYS